MMKMVPLAEVKNKLSEYLQDGETQPIVITKNGKPRAVLMPIEEDVDLEDRNVSVSRGFFEVSS